MTGYVTCATTNWSNHEQNEHGSHLESTARIPCTINITTSNESVIYRIVIVWYDVSFDALVFGCTNIENKVQQQSINKVPRDLYLYSNQIRRLYTKLKIALSTPGLLYIKYEHSLIHPFSKGFRSWLARQRLCMLTTSHRDITDSTTTWNQSWRYCTREKAAINAYMTTNMWNMSLYVVPTNRQESETK